MIAYKVTEFEAWRKKKNGIELMPVLSKKGYFLPDLRELWPELDWAGLETIEINEIDLINEEP